MAVISRATMTKTFDTPPPSTRVWASLLLVGLLWPLSYLTAQSTGGMRPNVILFYADDLGWGDLTGQGSDYYETPNIDRIASEGIRFTNAYANAANCAPSRACLMTGLYTPRHGIFTVKNPDRGKSEHRRLIPTPNRKVLDTALLTMPQFFKKQGYATCMAGKWHLSSDASDYGFDANFGGHQAGGPRSYFSPYKNPQLADGPAGEYLPERLATEVHKWIEARADDPFFVYLPFYSVHTPIQARSDLTEKYAAKKAGKHHNHPEYAAMIEAMDRSVGLILDQLDTLGLSSNTLVIFSSDNGGYGGVTISRPLRGSKGMFYEGGIRVPFYVRWPAQCQAGQTIETPIIGSDVLPTMMDLLNPGSAELPLDGHSILPLLQGKKLRKRALFWHFPAYLQMYQQDRAFADSHDQPHFRTTPVSVIRSGHWKLLEFFETGDLELYHLGQDIGERSDLSQVKPGKVRKMHRQLQHWRMTTSAPVPTQRNPEFVE